MRLYRKKLAKAQRGGGVGVGNTDGPDPLNVFSGNMVVNGHREAIVQRFNDYICIKRDSIKQIGRALMDTIST